ncbi:MAG TPA: DNA polymerase III subunit delta [Micropepsaceae bacterium]
MDIKSHLADRFVSAPPSTLVAALFYGPDQGMVRERAARLAKSVVPDLSDPFRVAELDDAALDSDPARLWDEAAALSMIGGRRVVRVRGAGNGLAKDFERFLSDPKGDALIVVEAGELAKNAALRRIFEEADNAAAIACYPDNERDLEEVVRSALKDFGLGIEPDALDDAVSRLGSDRGVTRVELEKLALYAMGEKTVSQAHVAAIMGDESELRMDETLDAAGEGNYAGLDMSLSRLWAAGTSPVAVLRQALTHFQRLLLVRAQTDEGNDTKAAMRKLRPPVHFAREADFRGQVSRWTAARLEEALTLLYEAEALVKTTAVPAEAACGRALLSVAALANARRAA